MVLAVCIWLGYARARIVTGKGHVAVWVETFGLYMLIFLVLGLVFSRLKLPIHTAALSGFAALASLSALLWPLIRGVSVSEMRSAIGLTTGRGLLQEIAAGVATYVMTLPLVGIGLLVTILIMMLAKKLPGIDSGGPEDSAPSHPIVPMLVGAHWSVKLTIFVLASVIAPLVEEIMFRGLLYRHLREATGRIGGFLSFFISTAIVSFVFAAIHPQGWMGIPPLMAIAFGLTIAREWRSSLISCIVAHSINNTLMLTLVLLTMG
jgi:membrane protease YdiL (CAAX protease family)